MANSDRDSGATAMRRLVHAKQKVLLVPKENLSEERGGHVCGHRAPGSGQGRGRLGESRHKSGREQLLESSICRGGRGVEVEKSGRKNLKTSASWREYGLVSLRGAVLRKLLIARFCSW